MRECVEIFKVYTKRMLVLQEFVSSFFFVCLGMTFTILLVGVFPRSKSFNSLPEATLLNSWLWWARQFYRWVLSGNVYCWDPPFLAHFLVHETHKLCGDDPWTQGLKFTRWKVKLVHIARPTNTSYSGRETICLFLIS